MRTATIPALAFRIEKTPRDGCVRIIQYSHGSGRMPPDPHSGKPKHQR